MKLNTTTQHAVRIMTYISKLKDKKFHNAKDISQALDIPYKYLTSIMSQLVSAELLTSVQGREGGYFLAKKDDEINILDVLVAVNEPLPNKTCILGTSPCDENKKCMLHDQWVNPRKSMMNMFTKTTLADVNKDNYKI